MLVYENVLHSQTSAKQYIVTLSVADPGLANGGQGRGPRGMVCGGGYVPSPEIFFYFESQIVEF